MEYPCDFDMVSITNVK